MQDWHLQAHKSFSNGESGKVGLLLLYEYQGTMWNRNKQLSAQYNNKLNWTIDGWTLFEFVHIGVETVLTLNNDLWIQLETTLYEEKKNKKSIWIDFKED